MKILFFAAGSFFGISFAFFTFLALFFSSSGSGTQCAGYFNGCDRYTRRIQHIDIFANAVDIPDPD